ncbi:hypothetical protein ITP53_18800 [Nonomuraea sp. K274]|uniref:Uncharacterized protein n=1 Tax=Nonomuraea cypriaca TaxID=1187855 RepID=A0A931EYW8_9ACTN|nr:hypothetical protein [Nonomuraea cypriaca]MBF8187745.1 hypothetical protein [Nonomuraea cypriaca]
MDTTTIDYADLAEYDRRQRGIERHLLAAFAGGLVIGLAGILISGTGPGWAGRIYDPYAYLALSLVVGATASGFGWALVTTFLAMISTLVAAIGASAVGGGDPLDIAGLDWALVLLVGLGLLAYLTRRHDGWGDLAAGAVVAALIGDAVDRAGPGLTESEQSLWPGPALAVGLPAIALMLVLRRNARGRLRAVLLSAMFASVFTGCLVAFVSGWSPLAV